LYSGYRENAFVERENYPLEEMLRYGDGDAIVLCTTNADLSAVDVRHGSWSYRSTKLTQFWRVPARHIQPDLRVKVNGRHVYWASDFVVPGGDRVRKFRGARALCSRSGICIWTHSPGTLGNAAEDSEVGSLATIEDKHVPFPIDRVRGSQPELRAFCGERPPTFLSFRI